MRKMIKMSLVAAVAVAGLTTSASAQSMEDAIKNVTFGGSVEYRMEHRFYDDADSTDGENAKIVLKAGTKVNDTVSFDALAVVNGQGSSGADATSTTQGSPNINVAKFTFKTSAATVIVGMQQLATPWTDAGDGARANGVLALVPAGPVTIAAAYFRDSQMGIDSNAALGSSNMGALAAIGKAGSVAYQAWFLQIGSGNGALPEGGTALALTADAKVGPAKVSASYASLEGDEDTLEKQTLMKAVVTVPAGPVALVAGMAIGGDDGDLVTFDSDAKVGFESWSIRAGQGAAELEAMTVAVVAPVSAAKVKVQYTTVETTTVEANEILLQASYKMSKNFGGYLRHAIFDVDGGDTMNRTRLSIKYTF